MSLYARDLTNEEGKKIQGVLRRGKNVIFVRRCQVILFSAQGMKVREIAGHTYLCEEYIRRLIRLFNSDGLGALRPKKPGGKEPVFTPEQRAEIIELALIPPKVLGHPFTQWSLNKLREAAISRGIVKDISHETIRQILKENKIKYLKTKTWKESNDPDFEAKKNE